MPRDHDPEDRDRGFATRAIHGQALPPVDQDTPSVPIFQTSTFRFDTSDGFAETINFRRPGYTYTRGYGNPTLLAFERVMAELEGTESALSFASGMAAIHTVATTLAANGDTIVASNELYGGTYSLFAHVLPRYGIDVRFVDPHDPDAVRAALRRRGDALRRDDREPERHGVRPRGARPLASAAGVPSVVDNTFASPYLCTPASFGFDYVAAFGDQVHRRPQRSDRRHRLHVRGADGGAALHGDRDRWDARTRSRRGCRCGACRRCRCGWTATAGRRSSSPGGSSATRRSRPCTTRGSPSHPQHEVARRMLPRGFGGMAAFEVVGGVEAGQRFCDALELIWVAASLGGIHTLVCHAASTTHRQLDADARRAAGIADGLIRLSVGLEDVEDLIEDVERALEKV